MNQCKTVWIDTMLGPMPICIEIENDTVTLKPNVNYFRNVEFGLEPRYCGTMNIKPLVDELLNAM